MRKHDSIPDPNNQLAPYQPTEILDPYPERPNHTTGVRQHTRPTTPQTWTSPTDLDELAPLPFGEWVEPQTPHARRRWYPWASTGLYAMGQLILAVLIALETVGPVVGITVCLLWLTCGVILIASQVLSQRTAEVYDR